MTDRMFLKYEPQNESTPVYAFDPYETRGAAGFDLRADLRRDGVVVIEPGDRVLIDTGIKVEVPEGYELQVRSRSGLALKHGIAVLNSPGTVDSDYRGKVGVILINHGKTPFTVRHGDRIAQAVIASVVQVHLQLSEVTNDTDRGTGGFGSTGTK